MFPIPTGALKYIAAAVAAIGLVGGAFYYRSHVYDEGYAAAQAADKQAQTAALAKLKTDDDAAAAKATTQLQAQLKDETNAHKARQTQLEAALAAARADSVGLSSQLVSLHNAATAGSAGPAGDAPGAGPQGTGAQADGASVIAGPGQFTLGDLMRNDESNFTLCRKNSDQLTALQDWYEGLRAGDSGLQRKAIDEAPTD